MMKYVSDITNIDSKVLSIILKRHNIRLKRKKNNPQNCKFTEGDVLSSYITTCNYAGGEYKKMIEKKHLHIRFVTDVEKGIVHLSLLFDEYKDLIPNCGRKN